MKKVLVCGFCTQDRIDNKSYFGGAAGGISLNLAFFNIPVGIISVLGNDKFTRLYFKEFQKRDVDTSLITYSKGRLPQLTVVAKENKESSRKFRDFNAKQILNFYRPNKSLLNKYDLLHVVNTPELLCDYLASSFSGEISYCPGSLFVRDPSSLSQTLLSKSSYIFCNQEEYLLLRKRVSINNYFKTKLKILCVTYGERGVTMITKNLKKQFPILKKSKVVDVTGAGDALVVGFLKEIIARQEFELGIKEGMRLSSLVVRRRGVLL